MYNQKIELKFNDCLKCKDPDLLKDEDNEDSDDNKKEEMIYFDFEKKFNTINFLTSSMYKPKVSVIYWGLNSIMDDLRMAQMSNNIVSIARSKIEEMNWLKAIID